MRRVMKKWMGLILALALVMGLLPAMPTPAHAEDYYFLPDIGGIRASRDADLNVTDATSVKYLPNIAYTYKNNYLTIEGTFQSVDPTSISVKIEQIVSSGNKWVVDSTRYVNTGATTNGLNFSATNLELYPGYNKITISGLNGSVTRSESFYVRYSDMPLLKSMKVGSGVSEPVSLNEGTKVVVENKQVYLQGEVQNASKITFNGQVTYPQEDGKFYSPALSLTAGENIIEMVISNQNNSLTVKRTIYYYDPSLPFLSYKMTLGGSEFNLYNNVPTVTGDGTDGATFKLEMLFANLGPSVADHVAVMIGSTTVNAKVDQEIQIPGKDGVSTAYRLVTISTTDLYKFSDPAKQLQDVPVSVVYTGSPSSNYQAKLTASFNYLPGELAIKQIQLVDDYNVAGTDLKNFTLKNLEGSQVASSTFYVAVRADKQYLNTADALKVQLLPYATTELNVTFVGNINGTVISSTDAMGDYKLYKVSNLPIGPQQIRFIFKNNSNNTYMKSYMNANLNYVSENYIQMDDLYDGQIKTIDSKSVIDTDRQIKVSGKFSGFETILTKDDAKMYINSTPLEVGLSGTAANTFSNTIDVVDSGSKPEFHYGQNSIVIEAKYISGNDTRIVRKEIKFYIVDRNVSRIDRVQPGVSSDKTNLQSLEDTVIFKTTYQDAFPILDGKYQSRDKMYDLIIKGSNANRVVVRKNGAEVFSYELQPTNEIKSPSGLTFYGSSKLFYLRLENIIFEVPGTHVYTIELYTATGAVTTQTVTVAWAYNSYQVLSPIPTVGGRIVVNKNFVTVDIQAEGAKAVLVDGKPATKFNETPSTIDHYQYEYVGLKPDKDNVIKFQVQRESGVTNGTITVYYTSSVQVGSQYKQAMGNKYSLFDKGLTLEFPKNTLLKKASPASKVEEFYQHNLRFGIAYPEDGIVERIKDNGNIVYPSGLVYSHFIGSLTRENFTRVSPVYWISGGVGVDTSTGGKEKDGLQPYDPDGTFIQPVTERKLVPTNRGTLTLKFDQAVVDSVGSIITVYYLGDDPYAEWTRIGGAVDTKNNTITVPFDDFGYYMVTKLRFGFQDITNHQWARNVLEGMYAKGFMTNLRYREFGPYDYASRGEFATLLIKALNIPLRYDNTPTFLDVYPGSKSTTWDYKYIETAARVGITTGYDNQIFMPDGRLTREQAATMIARAMELKLALNDSKLSANLSKQFTDVSSMSYYALPAISEVYKQGIMLGEENAAIPGEKKPTYRFNPLGQLKRDEAAQIAMRLLQKNTNIFPKNLN